MKVKSLALAVGALGVVTAVVWFFNRGTDGPVADARIGQPVLDNATIARADGMYLRSGDNEVTLVNADPAGSSWVVKEYHDLPVEFSKLNRLVTELKNKETGINRFVGSKPERLEKLGFNGDRIELRDKDGKPVWTLHLGASPEKGGRFVKFDDEAKAYLTGLNTYVDGIAKNWADTTLVGAQADDVVGLEVRFPEGGSLTATRIDGKGIWKCQDLADGETLKDSEVTSLATKLATLRFMEAKEPESLETIAGRPTARTYKITLADGRIFTITASQRQDPVPVPETPPAEGVTPPAPQPQPADVYVQSSKAEDPINALMARRSFQVAEWTFSSLPTKRDALVNAAPAPAPAAPAPAPAAEVAPAPAAEPAATP